MAKVMVSMPDELLDELDAEVARRATTRSALLALAARNELARPTPDALSAAVTRSRARFARSGPFDASDLVRTDRDARR